MRVWCQVELIMRLERKRIIMKKIILLMILVIVSVLSFGCGDESKAKNNDATTTTTNNNNSNSSSGGSSNTLITIGENEEDLGISPEDFKASYNKYVKGYAEHLEKDSNNKSGVNFRDFEIVSTEPPNDKGENGCFKLKNKMQINYTISQNKKIKKIAHLPIASGHEAFIYNPTEELNRVFIALVMTSSFIGDKEADKIVSELKNKYDSSEKKEAFYELKDKGIAMCNIKDMYVFLILNKKDFNDFKNKK